MNVANLELCRELFKLSGWKDTGFFINKDGVVSASPFYYGKELPAYDLGYLLRKLPHNREFIWTDEETGETSSYRGNVFVGFTAQGKATAGYHGTSAQFDLQYADTPEDAAAQLCIELFKQGVLVVNKGGL